MNTIKYLLVNTVFAIVIYLGLFKGIEWAENVAYFLAWASAVGSLCVLSDDFLKRMAEGDNPPPAWLRTVTNLGFIFAFVSVGSWFLGACLLFGWLLFEGARSRSGELKQRAKLK